MTMGKQSYGYLLTTVLISAATTASAKINPYQKGCLYSQNLTLNIRVCGRDDPPSAIAAGSCRQPPFDYPEVRLQPGDWESPFFSSWILQIVLSEVLHVPVSYEMGDPFSSISLYHPDMPLDFHSNYRHYLTAFETAHELNGDCSKADTSPGDNYQLCAHFITENWHAKRADVQDFVYRDILEPPQSLNMLAQQGWYIPKFTAQKDPSLSSYFGMQGDANRHKLAQTFKRPQTWQQYCDFISPNHCATPDLHAQRAPNTTLNEPDRMYAKDLYKGYFLATEKNNCTANPDTCTGHFVQYPCQWSSDVPTQLYYLNISLDPDTDETGGRTFSQMVDTWRAAQANQEDVVVYWWSPELLMFEMSGSDAEFIPVNLPTPTVECSESATGNGQHCAADPLDRLGPPEAVCGDPAKGLHSLMSTTVYSPPGTDQATASPAHASLAQFELTELQLGQLFSRWNELGDPRQAVCEWVADNLEYIQPFIPRTYPRVPLRKDAQTPLLYASTILGGIVMVLVLLTMVLVYENRACRTIQYAQIEFLGFLLVGSLFIAIGAIVMGAPPSSASCIVEVWLINLGYTAELVPLVVKVAAVNHITQAGRSMKRAKINREFLFGVVICISVLVVVFLTVWTVLDPPQLTHEYELTETINENGETTVLVLDVCASESIIWRYVALGWNGFLLLCTTILAIQMRKIQMVGFNETATLALLVYSHMMFLLLRVVTYLLSSEDVSQYTLARCQSMIFSLDTAATILIYFVPKLVAKDELRSDSLSTFQSSTRKMQIPASNPAPRPTQAIDSTGSGFAEVPVEVSVPEEPPVEEHVKEHKVATTPKNKLRRFSRPSGWIDAAMLEIDGEDAPSDSDSASPEDGGEPFHDDSKVEDENIVDPLLKRNRELEDENGKLKKQIAELMFPNRDD